MGTCSVCGSVVTVHHTLDGARYLLPVSSDNTDALVHDRLRRAEKIIVDLRQQLRDKAK